MSQVCQLPSFPDPNNQGAFDRSKFDEGAQTAGHDRVDRLILVTVLDG